LTNAPPSRVEWALESEPRGHSPSETIAYLADCADFEDAQQDRRRSLPPGLCRPRPPSRDGSPGCAVCSAGHSDEA
jgi:hypothetical protein